MANPVQFTDPSTTVIAFRLYQMQNDDVVLSMLYLGTDGQRHMHMERNGATIADAGDTFLPDLNWYTVWRTTSDFYLHDAPALIGDELLGRGMLVTDCQAAAAKRRSVLDMPGQG